MTPAHTLEPSLLIYDVQRLKEHLSSALNELVDGDPVRLDCSSLRELDCSGAQLLAEFARELRTRTSTLRLEGLHADIFQNLSLIGLDHWFDVEIQAK